MYGPTEREVKQVFLLVAVLLMLAGGAIFALLRWLIVRFL